MSMQKRVLVPRAGLALPSERYRFRSNLIIRHFFSYFAERQTRGCNKNYPNLFIMNERKEKNARVFRTFLRLFSVREPGFAVKSGSCDSDRFSESVNRFRGGSRAKENPVSSIAWRSITLGGSVDFFGASRRRCLR